MEKSKQKLNLLLGVSGSVATIKLEPLLKLFLESQKFNIKVISTEKSQHFFNENQIQQNLNQNIEFINDEQEWSSWSKKGDPVLHIELRKWADIYLIAPLSANTMAKIVNLLSDNLITCVARAWDFKKSNNLQMDFQQYKNVQLLEKPFIVAPAMNTLMFDHPGTEEQLQKMQKWGITVMDTVEKLLACNDYGKGAMAEPETIFNLVIDIYNKKITQ